VGGGVEVFATLFECEKWSREIFVFLIVVCQSVGLICCFILLSLLVEFRGGDGVWSFCLFGLVGGGRDFFVVREEYEWGVFYVLLRVDGCLYLG